MRSADSVTCLKAEAVLALLLVQLGVLLLTHLGGTNARRLFAWAPNDYVVDYVATAHVDGRPLDARAFEARYRLPARGILEDPLEALTHRLRAREQMYAGGEHVQLTVRYRLNGHAPELWRWVYP